MGRRGVIIRHFSGLDVLEVRAKPALLALCLYEVPEERFGLRSRERYSEGERSGLRPLSLEMSLAGHLQGARVQWIRRIDRKSSHVRSIAGVVQ